jgi:hypothetical protein
MLECDCPGKFCTGKKRCEECGGTGIFPGKVISGMTCMGCGGSGAAGGGG